MRIRISARLPVLVASAVRWPVARNRGSNTRLAGRVGDRRTHGLAARNHDRPAAASA